MTEKEKIIATAYTGIMFIEGRELGKLYEYEEEKLGHGVVDIMYANDGFADRVRKAVLPDFLDMLNGKYAGDDEPFSEHYGCKHDPNEINENIIKNG